MAADTTTPQPHLHSYRISRRAYLNRVFAVVYTLAIISLIYHHLQTLFLPSNTFTSVSITLTLLISDLILSFMWLSAQSFRMNPISRQVFPEKLEKVLERSKFPGLDIFICTADPYKEPPLNVVNTALSVMGYDYPPEKISVYVSDDGGSQLTLFAFMEAAKFAKHWLPFCTRNHVIQRCPDSYFKSNYSVTTQIQDLKVWCRLACWLTTLGRSLVNLVRLSWFFGGSRFFVFVTASHFGYGSAVAGGFDGGLAHSSADVVINDRFFWVTKVSVGLVVKVFSDFSMAV